MNNVIERIKYKINKSEVPKLEDILNQTFREIDKIYGYFVSVSFDNNEHTGFVIHYSICMNDYYNTVLSERAISNILKSIRSYTDNPENLYIIAFDQPPPELMIQLYDPVIKKLASKYCKSWSCLEYEDVCQDGRLVMLTLQHKGYYLNKWLFEKSFNNYILMKLQKRHTDVELCSLDSVYYDNNNGDEQIKLSDTLVDLEEEYRKQDEDVKESERAIYEEIKSIIIEKIGQRRYDQLLRDYGFKHTTSNTRVQLNKIKSYLSMLGLTREDFNKKYH